MKKLTCLALPSIMTISVIGQNKNGFAVQTTIANGIIEGNYDTKSGIQTYFGVPFAKPPVGNLRWKAPQPLENWKGVKQTKKFGPRPMSTLSTILNNKIVAIIRGADPDDVLQMIQALCEGGVQCVEITLNSADALRLIESVAIKMEGRVIVGAGTVLNASEVRSAVAAGAKFIISPIVNIDVIHKTRDLGAVSIPGAYTPTEIFTAFSNGADLIKVFPSSAGPSFIREVLAPFPYIPLM